MKKNLTEDFIFQDILTGETYRHHNRYGTIDPVHKIVFVMIEGNILLSLQQGVRGNVIPCICIASRDEVIQTFKKFGVNFLITSNFSNVVNVTSLNILSVMKNNVDNITLTDGGDGSLRFKIKILNCFQDLVSEKATNKYSFSLSAKEYLKICVEFNEFCTKNSIKIPKTGYNGYAAEFCIYKKLADENQWLKHYKSNQQTKAGYAFDIILNGLGRFEIKTMLKNGEIQFFNKKDNSVSSSSGYGKNIYKIFDVDIDAVKSMLTLASVTA